MLRSRLAVALVLAVVLLAGCGGRPSTPTHTTPPATSTPTAPPTWPATIPGSDDVEFDGEAALGWVKAVALREDGSPRYRIPGSTGQAEGAAVLWEASDIAGWARSWDNFTGADYRALDTSRVATYAEVGPYCKQTDHDAVAGLTFSNLFAVLPGQSSRMVILGAHWDSQMESNYDRDPAKRHLPDPGANDGASGVGVLLQLMHELADQPRLPVTVGVLFIDGEDGFFSCYPLAGSLHFAQTVPLDDVGAFVLLDMVGDPGARYIREKTSNASAPELLDLVWKHGQRLAPEAFTDRASTIEDDHVAFIQAGVPSIDIIDAGRPGTGFPPQWDTTGDTVDKLSAGMLHDVGATLVRTLNDDYLPAIVFKA